MSRTLLELKTDLNDELGRSDYGTLIAQWVRNIEAKMDRVLEFPINEQVFYQPLVKDSEIIPLPTNHLTARKVVYELNDIRTPLIYLTPSAFDEMFPVGLNSAPTHYTISGVNLRLGPKVAEVSTVEILYQLRVDKMVLDGDTNDITIENSDIYFNGLVYEANIHFKDFDSAAVFKGRFEESMTDANDRHFDRRFSGPILMNLNGSFGG